MAIETIEELKKEIEMKISEKYGIYWIASEVTITRELALELLKKFSAS